jgi:transglutaminase-like putative cysteine protease
MKILTVHHATVYRYREPVHFGDHLLRIRPRDSHDLRLLRSELTLSPPGNVRWLHDVFGNSIAVVAFPEAAAELKIASTLTLERYALERPIFPVTAEAATYPFVYSPNDRIDLARLLEPHYPDPKGEVAAWAQQFAPERGVDTIALLADMNAAIKRDFAYAERQSEGTQSPIETLERHSGSCRDFALLLIEAARCLGFGARFVTGYLYDPRLDGAQDEAVQGAGATHAWAEIYLPGTGWVEYDPTNGIIAGENLIRVAVTRDPSQGLPVEGSFIGEAESFIGMEVEVTVMSGTRVPDMKAGTPETLAATA